MADTWLINPFGQVFRQDEALTLWRKGEPPEEPAAYFFASCVGLMLASLAAAAVGIGLAELTLHFFGGDVTPDLQMVMLAAAPHVAAMFAAGIALLWWVEPRLGRQGEKLKEKLKAFGMIELSPAMTVDIERVTELSYRLAALPKASRWPAYGVWSEAVLLLTSPYVEEEAVALALLRRLEALESYCMAVELARPTDWSSLGLPRLANPKRCPLTVESVDGLLSMLEEQPDRLVALVR